MVKEVNYNHRKKNIISPTPTQRKSLFLGKNEYTFISQELKTGTLFTNISSINE